MPNQQRFLSTATPLPAMLWWAIQLILVALTLQLFSPALTWMWDAWLSQEHRYQLIGVLLLIGFTLQQRLQGGQPLWQLPSLRFRSAPLLLFSACVIGFVFNAYFIDIHILAASLAVLSGYALFGFYSAAETWRKGLLPTLLLILLLPFGDYLDVYLGFPLRLFTANASADLLSAMGYTSASSETIIILENNYANVDLSCSGIKGVWSGLAFYTLLTWVEDKPIGLGWAWRLTVFVLALIAANIIRVTSLVLLGSTFLSFPYANQVHEVLGIIGFALACLIGWGLLLTLQRSATVPSQTTPHVLQNTLVSLLGVLALVLTLNVLYTPMPKISPLAVNTELTLPLPWAAQTTDLTVQEAQFFNRNEAKATKYSFQPNAETSASLIVVQSSYWKGQHDPRNCLIAQGYRIVDDTTLRLSATEYIRYMNVIKGQTPLVAIHWFQNNNLLTDDYGQRLFSGLFHKDEPWALVSMLIQLPRDRTLVIHELIDPIKHALQQKLNNSN